MRYLGRFDEAIASIALVLMAVIPLIEILVRPFMGKGIENALSMRSQPSSFACT